MNKIGTLQLKPLETKLVSNVQTYPSSPYSYRNASIGSNNAALRAGYIPKNKPIITEKPKAPIIAIEEIIVFHPARDEIT